MHWAGKHVFSIASILIPSVLQGVNDKVMIEITHSLYNCKLCADKLSLT